MPERVLRPCDGFEFEDLENCIECEKYTFSFERIPSSHIDESDLAKKVENILLFETKVSEIVIVVKLERAHGGCLGNWSR